MLPNIEFEIEFFALFFYVVNGQILRGMIGTASYQIKPMFIIRLPIIERKPRAKITSKQQRGENT